MAKTESVSAQMKELLDEINDDIRKATKNNIDRTAKESVQKLKNTSPVKTGSYAKGWGTKKQGDMDVVVHNRTDYQLTHLLENGHVIKNKKGEYGRTRPIKHIEPAEQEGIQNFEQLVRAELEGIS